MKEDEFWRNYFYRVNLIKQSFDLKDMESSAAANSKPSNIDELNQSEIHQNDEDVNNIPR